MLLVISLTCIFIYFRQISRHSFVELLTPPRTLPLKYKAQLRVLMVSNSPSLTLFSYCCLLALDDFGFPVAFLCGTFTSCTAFINQGQLNCETVCGDPKSFRASRLQISRPTQVPRANAHICWHSLHSPFAIHLRPQAESRRHSAALSPRPELYMMDAVPAALPSPV